MVGGWRGLGTQAFAHPVTNYVEKCIKSVTRGDTRFNGSRLNMQTWRTGRSFNEFHGVKHARETNAI